MLPKCAETYEHVFGDIAESAARNMQICIQSESEFDFYHYFNIDRGTLSNPDHIRNCMLFYMKQSLNIEQTSKEWTNQHGITFDFTEYYVIVGQELYHLVIRCRNKRIWNYHHSDCWLVIRAFQSVSTQYQRQYNIETTPDVITDIKSTPYDVYEHCPLLTDDKLFSIVQNVIICYLQLKGTNIKHTEYTAELTRVLLSDELYDTDDELLAKGVVAKMLSWCFDHLTPKSIARFESVMSIYFFLPFFI